MGVPARAKVIIVVFVLIWILAWVGPTGADLVWTAWFVTRPVVPFLGRWISMIVSGEVIGPSWTDWHLIWVRLRLLRLCRLHRQICALIVPVSGPIRVVNGA